MTTTPDLSFRDRGACVGLDPAMFYPDSGDSTPVQDARAACALCAVQAECRDWGLRHERYGIWGGTTEKERRKLRKTLRIAMSTPTAHAVESHCGTIRGWRAHLYRGESPCGRCSEAKRKYQADYMRKYRAVS